MVHAPRGFWPILNSGELAALYCFVFLTFAALGPGRFSIDGLLHRVGEAPRERPGTVPEAEAAEYPSDRRKRRRRVFRV